MRRVTTLLLIALPLAGIDATTSAAPPQAKPSPACRVFVTEEDPPARNYTIVRKEISATKKFYGSHDDALIWEMVDSASEAGAEAVVKFQEKRAITMFSWASARVSGMAVKWTTAGRTAMRSMRGNCWNVKTRKIE